jgi:hypothetical protein
VPIDPNVPSVTVAENPFWFAFAPTFDAGRLDLWELPSSIILAGELDSMPLKRAGRFKVIALCGPRVI